MGSNSKTKQTNKKWSIGTPVPDRLFQLINLYTISRGISKSQIMRDGLLWWVDRNEVTVEKMVEDLSHEYQNIWLRKKSEVNESDQPKEFDNFITRTKITLREQKVNDNLVEQIIERIKQ